MLCAAIDIGSNTTRVLVAEPQEGQLRKVMEQRAYTRIGKDSKHDGAIDDDKIAEVAEVVTTQVRLAEELGAEAIRIVATAAIREATNPDETVAAAIAEVGRASRSRSSASRRRAGSRSSARPRRSAIRSRATSASSTSAAAPRRSSSAPSAGGVREVRSFKIGSGSLAEDFLNNDPPSAAEIRALRDHIADFFDGVEVEQPDQAVAVGGSATSLRTLVGAVLEYETLERAVRVLTGDPVAEVAKRFELDPRRVRILPAGVLLLEKLSELLGQPLQIGKGGLREGIILDLLNGAANGAPQALAA